MFIGCSEISISVIVLNMCNTLKLSVLFVCLGEVIKFFIAWGGGGQKKYQGSGLLGGGGQYPGWHYANIEHWGVPALCFPICWNCYLLELFVVYLLNSSSCTEEHPVKNHAPLARRSLNHGVLCQRPLRGP